MKDVIATRASWKTEAMPASRAKFPFALSLSREERDRLVRGCIPEEMEDKWFIFHEQDWVYFHRSWTGYCIFQIKLKADGDGYDIEEALVNRDPEQYRNEDFNEDVRSLKALLYYRFNIGAEPQDN
jgi:hypothetical protein